MTHDVTARELAARLPAIENRIGRLEASHKHYGPLIRKEARALRERDAELEAAKEQLATLQRLARKYLDAERTRERAGEEGWEEPEYRAAYHSVEITGDALADALPKEKP